MSSVKSSTSGDEPWRGSPAVEQWSSFVVTSSNDANFSNPSSAAPNTTATATAMASVATKSSSVTPLNPEAREFQVSSALAGTLFALPSAAPLASTALQSQAPPQPPRWMPTRGVEQQQQQQQRRQPQHSSSRSTATAGGKFSTQATMAFNTASAAADALNSPPQLMELTEAYMHERYDGKCAAEQLHLVSVFHLHPRTTDAQLSRIFFPTGASAAVVLDPREMPEPLASAYHAARQRAGVVFFARKAFAMVGVEKINEFVPHGQHQPLVVRYCGLDEKLLSPSGSSSPVLAPPRAQATSPPPSSRPTPAQAHHRDATRPPGSTLSTPVAVPQLRMGGNVALAGETAACTTYDLIDQSFLQKYAAEPDVFLVGVHNLAHGTTTKALYKMFYPMGALNSELLPRPVSVEGKLRCSGVAVFGSKGMAMEAAEKMNNFVPHGQRRPIVARFLERGVTPTSVASLPVTGEGQHSHHRNGSGTAVATASTPRDYALSPTSTTTTTTVSSAAALLEAIERHLRSRSINDDQLAADMAALMLCAESGEAEVKRLAEIVRDVLLLMGAHSTVLASPLSGALRTLHSTLGIPLRAASSSSPAADTDALPSIRKALLFLQQLGRTFMMLVADTGAARQTRTVAAVQCAYLYQYSYLPRTPLSFATTLFHNCATELREARGFLCREPEVPCSLAEEQQHRPWITLVDALEEMVQVWRSLDPVAYTEDASRDAYESFVCQFRGIQKKRDGDRRITSTTAAIDHANDGACTPRNDTRVPLSCGAGAAPAVVMSHSAKRLSSGPGQPLTGSAKASHLITPSARPTPRRVVSKSYSTTGDWKAKQCTPVTGSNSSTAPQVMLASAVSHHTQGVSESSVENSAAAAAAMASSGGGGALSSAARTAALAPEHPCMRFQWGSRFFTGSAPSATATPVPSAAAGAGSVLSGAPSVMVSTGLAALAPGGVTLPTATTTTAAGTPCATPATERSDATMTECTVYITKMPSRLTAGQVRRLLLHFGEFRKVRLCHDDKEMARAGSAEALAAHHLKFDQLCFGFVEFADVSGTKAMIEFFRNEVHHPNAFSFLRLEAEEEEIGSGRFEESELSSLHNTRTSQARNPIHDQHPLDATRTQPCLFGLVRPDHPVDTYTDAISSEEVAAVVRQLQAAAGEVSAQASPTSPTPVLSAASPKLDSLPSFSRFFSSPTAATTERRRGELETTAASIPAAPLTPDAVTSSTPSLQPFGDVHFPSNFPYHEVFAEDVAGPLCTDDDLHLSSGCIPVIEEEEEEDENEEALQKYWVQQFLASLS